VTTTGQRAAQDAAPDSAEPDPAEPSSAAPAPAEPDSAAPEDGSAPEDGPGEEQAADAPRRRVRLRLPGVLRRDPRRAAAVTAIAALLLTGGGLGYAAQQLKSPAAARNHALTDTGATSRLTGDISSALGRIFAYTPEDTRSTEQAARDSLEGAAAGQYRKLFAQIRDQIAGQQLTLSTRVVRAAVVSLTGDRARLLVFLDQTAQRAGAGPTTAAAQLSVSAHLVGGHWKIDQLTAR
jgi:Mce-associated membrane protein